MAHLSPLTREPRRAMLLAFGAASLLLLPGRVAEAQVPPVDECLANPASCLPEPELSPLPEPELSPLPEVDECIANPASCLSPPVDDCVQNPASCLPPSSDLDPCTQDPTSCLPKDVDKCVDDLARCVPETIDRCTEDVPSCVRQEDPAEEDEDEGGALAPAKGNGPPRASADGSNGGTQRVSDGPTIDPTPLSSEAAEGARLRPATTTGGVLERIRGGLADAAQRFAFPLGVAALVGAFLLIQGRIDRRDPKLAAAPIESRHDVVPFR